MNVPDARTIQGFRCDYLIIRDEGILLEVFHCRDVRVDRQLIELVESGIPPEVAGFPCLMRRLHLVPVSTNAPTNSQSAPRELLRKGSELAAKALERGFGYLTRRHGWTCDNLRSLEVVTADAKVLQVSAEEHPDLFWALRGGGGNFGIVTSFEYRLVPVGPEILGGAIAWPGEDAKQVLDAYRAFSVRAPRELTSVAVLRIAPPAPWLPKEVHGKPIAAIFLCHSGTPDEGDALVREVRKIGRPVAYIVTRRPYTQMQSLLDATQPKGRRYYWKTHYLATIDAEMICGSRSP